MARVFRFGDPRSRAERLWQAGAYMGSYGALESAKISAYVRKWETTRDVGPSDKPNAPSSKPMGFSQVGRFCSYKPNDPSGKPMGFCCRWAVSVATNLMIHRASRWDFCDASDRFCSDEPNEPSGKPMGFSECERLVGFRICLFFPFCLI